LSGENLAQGPAQMEVPGESGSSMPETPVEIIGVVVPSRVSEVIPEYVTPSIPASHGDLFVTETPKPKRRKPRPTGLGNEPATPNRILAPELPVVTAPVAATTFDSLDFVDNAINASSLFIPADPAGAAGPEHVVSVTNVSIQFHDKSGTPLLDSVAGGDVTGISLASFFAALSPANPTFDPKVIYDQDAGRFVVVTLELQDVFLGDASDASRILLAVSDDSNPLGAWYMVAVDSKVTIGVDSWADYPGFAVDEEAVYVTANMFGFFTSGATFTGNRVWIFDKFTGAGGGLYGGGTATVSLVNPVPVGGFEGTTQPAHIFGTAPTVPNVGTWFVYFSGLSNGSAEFLQVSRLDNPVGPGVLTLSGPFFLNLGDIDDLSGEIPDAPQLGTAETVETNDRRTLNAVWRNDGLYTVATIDPKTGDTDAGQATAHWIEVDTTIPGTPVLADQGNIGGEDIAVGTHTFFPSITVNDSDDLAIGFSASAPTIYPSSFYTTRTATDAAGTTTGSATLALGLDYYIRTFDSTPACDTPAASNRWGDYSGMATDPFDQCFWAYNKHAVVRGSGLTGGCNGRPAIEDGRWGTAFAYFCESCATNLELSSKTVSGSESFSTRDNLTASTVTVESTGDLTITSGSVLLDNGFAVDLGGELSITIGPCM